jgi:hypothetical protein
MLSAAPIEARTAPINIQCPAQPRVSVTPRSRAAARCGPGTPLQQHRRELSTTAGARWSRPPAKRCWPRRRRSSRAVKTILAGNDSPDIGFDLSINPYRGCEHGCIYCYARPTHSYLNLSPGLDFETRIVAKVNAAERLARTPCAARLRAAAAEHRLGHRRLPAGGATLRITRSVIEVLAEHRHPFSLITKSWRRARHRPHRADGEAGGWLRCTCRSPRWTRNSRA